MRADVDAQIYREIGHRVTREETDAVPSTQAGP